MYRPDTEAEAILGSRGDCTPPREIKVRIRLVTRDGPLSQLIWVRPQTDGVVAVEPYCLKALTDPQVLPQQGSTKVELP